MKAKLRQELDMSKPVNLHKLSPMLKIYAGFVAKWHESKAYQSNLNKNLEATYMAKIKKEEKLKEVILAMAYKELMNNTSLESKDAVCEELLISVDQSYEDALKTVITTKDFLPYDVTFVQENSDVRRAFEDMPILIVIRKKQL